MKILICVLAVILCTLLLMALFLEKTSEAPPETTVPPTTTVAPETTVPPTTPPPETTVPPTTAHPVGWVERDGRLYYYDEQTGMVTGWQEIEGITYYFNEDGTRALGKTIIDGRTRYFDKTGAEVLLVNPWNYLPEDYTVELVELSTKISTANGKVSKLCYDDLMAMINACNKECPSICVVSTYRTYDYQVGLFNKKVKYYKNQGYGEEEAKRLAATVIAIPGTSEHHSGLAVDIVDTRSWTLDEIQETLPGQQWLMQNSWKYGWILRYPNGKSDATGIIYEPWHYRYVGKELAAELHDLDMCLEEYLLMLTDTVG